MKRMCQKRCLPSTAIPLLHRHRHRHRRRHGLRLRLPGPGRLRALAAPASAPGAPASSPLPPPACGSPCRRCAQFRPAGAPGFAGLSRHLRPLDCGCRRRPRGCSPPPSLLFVSHLHPHHLLFHACHPAAATGADGCVSCSPSVLVCRWFSIAQAWLPPPPPSLQVIPISSRCTPSPEV